jgi:multiple antibiotic resistance protein
MSFIIAMIAALLAATLGASMLEKWDVSPGALHLTAGLVLFLIALQPILSQYAPHQQAGINVEEPERPLSAMAFSPLAFPTIVTPYGIAVLILLVTIRPQHIWLILALTFIIFVLDLLAMLGAEFIMRRSFLVTVLGIIGTILGVLQVALGVQAVVNALHILGLTHSG